MVPPFFVVFVVDNKLETISLCRVHMRGYRYRCSSLCHLQCFRPRAFGLPGLYVEVPTCCDKEQRKPLQACVVANPLPALLHRDIHGMDRPWFLLAAVAGEYEDCFSFNDSRLFFLI